MSRYIQLDLLQSSLFRKKVAGEKGPSTGMVFCGVSATSAIQPGHNPLSPIALHTSHVCATRPKAWSLSGHRKRHTCHSTTCTSYTSAQTPDGRILLGHRALFV